MIKRNIPTFSAFKINTVVAFDVWAVDVDDLEQRRKKIKDLSLN